MIPVNRVYVYQESSTNNKQVKLVIIIMKFREAICSEEFNHKICVYKMYISL